MPGLAHPLTMLSYASKYDEMKDLGDEWESAAGSDSKARHRLLCRDRDNDGRYLNIVFFDSHKDAMENSSLAVTQEFSQRLMALADGEPRFHNLDIIEDRS